VVQKLFFVVVFRVKGADDDGLAVEDANNNIITIFLSSSRKRKGKCLRSSKEVSLSLPLFSLSLSQATHKKPFNTLKEEEEEEEEETLKTSLFIRV